MKPIALALTAVVIASVLVDAQIEKIDYAATGRIRDEV